MSSKYKNFLISNYVIIAFLILIVLVVNYILLSKIEFNQNTFVPITLCLIFGGLILYKFLSHSIFQEFFQSDREIDEMIKKTLHELNTPIATIQMNSKLLEKNITNEKGIQRLKRIHQASNNLLKLYEHMEYEITSKIDKVQYETFNMKDIIENSILKFDDIKGNISIIDKTNPSYISCDKFGFEIVCDNLISNAIKYNRPNGSITITNKHNILSIKDTGFGIETNNILKVYDKYYQEDCNQSGIGLGLNIIKKYCDDHKIRIKIDSKENIGTTFLLDFHKVSSKLD